MKRILRTTIERYNIVALLFIIALMFLPWVILLYSNIKNENFPIDEFIKFLIGSYIILIPFLVYILIRNYNAYSLRKSIKKFKKQAKRAEGHIVKLQKEYFEIRFLIKNSINNNKRAKIHHKIEVSYFNEDTNNFEIVNSQYFSFLNEKMLKRVTVNVFYVGTKAIIEIQK